MASSGGPGHGQQEVSMPFIPPEVLEIILLHCDGLTLTRAGMVCSLWRGVVQHLTRSASIWKKVCQEDMELEDVVELVNEVYPATKRENIWEDPMIDWLAIFRLSHSWRLAGSDCLPHRLILTFERPSIYITCMQMSGSCVVAGHADGSVSIYCDDGVFLEQICVHNDSVNDLALVGVFHQVDVTSFPWDIKHQYVISISNDGTIQINSLCPVWMIPTNGKIILQFPTDSLSFVRALGNNFLAVGENFMSLWEIEKPSDVFEKLDVTVIANVRQRNHPLRGATLWLTTEPIPNIIVNGLTDAGRLMTVLLFPPEKETEENNLMWTQQLRQDPIVLLPDDGQNISRITRNVKSFIWRDEVFVCLTSDYYMCLSIDGEIYKGINTKPYLNGFPASLLIIGQLFILGLNSGAVAIFHFKGPENFMDIDFNSPIYRVQLCSEAIIHLSLSVDTKALTLMAASARSMFLVPLK